MVGPSTNLTSVIAVGRCSNTSGPQWARRSCQTASGALEIRSLLDYTANNEAEAGYADSRFMTGLYLSTH